MIAAETGPFAAFRKWRLFIGRKFPMQGYQQSWIDEGFNCPLCVGFYTSFIFPLLYVDYVKFVIYCIAVAGLQVIIQTSEKK